ncbi:hypothetical protein BOTBODRAFT_507785 [Botryobasidium botryosum FD-172 SS1]|uniref:Heme peroxidase n=1 Tax=Botryobasidium botryosum (strain FD-172 SS1) TaxID=930990 RepID=A0A067MD41_BOTB1|nr:hypothetical protein BOTBODRAFT_507785 [Botryobasidium botryosum FD-172 SS1]
MSVFNATLSAAAQVSDLVRRSTSPLPTAPDGLTDSEAAPPSQKPHASSVDFIEALRSQIQRGIPLKLDSRTVSGITDALQHMNTIGLDDRKMALETLLTFMSRLPRSSILSQKIQNAVVSFLYYDLPHPPSTYLGAKYRFRAADGAGNNPLFPDLGRAGTPYSRSVQPKHPVPVSSMPDAGLLYDVLLRRDKFVPHPAGISSLMFSFAVIVIHSIFDTSYEDPAINNTTSYLDLSPLYGNDQAAQDGVRLKDGRGRLYEDVFAENRLMLMPPAVSALLVVFCRNHNFIAERLLQVNEHGTYTWPAPGDKQQMLKQDDEIFNIARLVNCGFFMSIILGDYIGAILGLTREGNSWSLDPCESFRTASHELVPRGEGDVVSVEFNLLYRWHATLSQADEKWMEDLFAEIFGHRNWDTITASEFTTALYKNLIGEGRDPRKWTFNGFVRQSNGRFADDDLAKVLHDATQNVAGAFKARGTPAVMRIMEMLGVEAGRKWGVCTLNEFRKFIGLKPYSSFSEWNPDQEIASAAERLYQHINNLELYVGMQAEETKPVVEGAGLCPGYTISRAILGDAIALTRGDRYLATDFTPFNLTAWGFQDCVRDGNEENGSFGGMMSKVLFRTLPDYYPDNSVFAHFPFMTPAQMEIHLAKLGLAKQYDFERPAKRGRAWTVVAYSTLQAVLSDPTTYESTYNRNMRLISNGPGFCSIYATKFSRQNQAQAPLVLSNALYPSGALEQYATFFREKSEDLILEKSFNLVGRGTKSVDIVRDVINIVPVYWVARQVAGIPIKTRASPFGIYTPQEIYHMAATLYSFVFLSINPEDGWSLQHKAHHFGGILRGYIKENIERLASRTISVKGLRHSVTNWIEGKEDQTNGFLQRVADTGRDIEQLSDDVLGLLIICIANYACAMTHIVNFYLDDERTLEREAIISLCRQRSDATSDGVLAGFAREALRFDPQAPWILRQATTDSTIEQGATPSLNIRKGDFLFLNVKQAYMDSHAFPNPTVVDPNRRSSAYAAIEDEVQRFIAPLWDMTMPQMMRSVFSLKNVRRAPGRSGELNRFTQSVHGVEQRLYLDYNGLVSPWPSSMIIQYDF